MKNFPFINSCPCRFLFSLIYFSNCSHDVNQNFLVTFQFLYRKRENSRLIHHHRHVNWCICIDASPFVSEIPHLLWDLSTRYSSFVVVVVVVIVAHCLRSLPIHKSAGSSHLFCIQHVYIHMHIVDLYIKHAVTLAVCYCLIVSRSIMFCT